MYRQYHGGCLKEVVMVFEKLKEIVVEQLQINPDDITRDSDIIKDLNADSLDIIEMLMKMEEEYNISIPDEKAAELKTVGDIADYVEAQIK